MTSLGTMVRRSVMTVVLLLACFQEASEQSGAQHSGAADVRALWVVRTSLTSPEKIANLVRRAANTGFDTLFAQVRGRGDAYYLGGPEPRAEELKGLPPDFDPLASLIREAEKLGLSVHAWVNVFYVWSNPQLPQSPLHWVNAYPHRLVMDEKGIRPKSQGSIEGAYLCPSDPDVQAHVREVIKHIVSNYRVAGIHLDYIRYPDEKFCYCEGCLARFHSWLGERAQDVSPQRAPARFPQEWNMWRRDQVTNMVRSISTDLKSMRRDLKLTAAVWPERNRASAEKLQDWTRWCRENLLDVVVPMNYAQGEAEFLRIAKDIKTSAGKVPVVMGIGSWRLSPEGTNRRIRAARELGFQGFSLFSYGGITQEGTTERYLNEIRDTILSK